MSPRSPRPDSLHRPASCTSSSWLDCSPRVPCPLGRRVALVALALFCVVSVGSAADRGLPAQNGVGNFGKVNDRLYRGAQPSDEALRGLKLLGIRSVINLRAAGEDARQEAVLAQAIGLTYTNVPLNGIRAPKHQEIWKALAIIESLPGPVFVHCQHGCDRTGTLIACYRIQYERWSNQAALEEARRYGLSRLERGMRRYIEKFGKASK